MRQQHVMVDLETLGTDPHAAIISLGAVMFDPEADLQAFDNTFYARINWDKDVHGRTVDPSTVQWWLQQNDAARAEILRPGETFSAALELFAEWFPVSGIIWGNGSVFDVTILQTAYKNNPPWSFRDVRDVRTIVDLAQGIVHRDSIPFDGTPHHALHDAIYQAKYVSAMWKELRRGR